jgi:hypothetical protein
VPDAPAPAGARRAPESAEAARRGREKVVIWLKACPRCGGDLFLEREIEGQSIRCLQCSGALTRAQEAALGIDGDLPARARSQGQTGIPVTAR